jgi:hypothetical protein
MFKLSGLGSYLGRCGRKKLKLKRLCEDILVFSVEWCVMGNYGICAWVWSIV